MKKDIFHRRYSVKLLANKLRNQNPKDLCTKIEKREDYGKREKLNIHGHNIETRQGNTKN